MGYPKSRPAFPPPGFNESVCALPSVVGNCAAKIGKEILNSHYANAHDFFLYSVVLKVLSSEMDPAEIRLIR
jgi:hypothetical protein